MVSSIFLYVGIFLFASSVRCENDMLSMLMPNVQPEYPETYLCTSVKIEPEMDEIYITGFEPNVTGQNAHHVLIVGCSMPGSTENLFPCNTISDEVEGGEHQFPFCDTTEKDAKSEFLYVWARNAAGLTFPEDVGFMVGGRSGIKYLILQVHYRSVDVFKDGSTDDTGIFVHYTRDPKPKFAGIFQVDIAGRILPHSTELLEAACIMSEDKEVHPFAFRAHTHDLGKVISGFKVNSDEKQSNWTLIGKRDPLLPQGYYPVTNEVTLNKGDVLAVRCTFHSDRDTVTLTGYAGDHEMCMYYILYWTLGPKLEITQCTSVGPPVYYWSNSSFLKNFPSYEEASTVSDVAVENDSVNLTVNNALLQFMAIINCSLLMTYLFYIDQY